MEKDAHVVTCVELDKCKMRVSELEAIVWNADVEEGEEPVFYTGVEDIHTIAELHNKGESGSEIGNKVSGQM